MKDLQQCRKEIDEIDQQIMKLFERRMNVSKNVVEMICVQSTEVDHAARLNTSELYEQDVQLISKGGKIFYLPSESGKLEKK